MFYDIMQEIENKFEEYLETLPCVSAEKVGLDKRCGDVYIDTEDNLIIVNKYSRIDYYGGFEYINEEYVQGVCGYKIYSEHNRVEDAVNYYIANSGGM